MVIRGFTREDLHGSFVYFIFSKELLYIGETQKIAFSRWVQHFHKNGTFSKKISIFGLPGVNYFSQVNMISVELDEIYNLPEVRWRTLSRAIEHAVHEQLYSSQVLMVNAYYHKYQPDVSTFRIISDTTRTKPMGISTKEWEFARSYARDLLNEVYGYL